jgi:hypothetical protein
MELLEVSFVNIPANPQAGSMALARGYDVALVNKLFGANESKGAIAFKDLGIMPKVDEWDGPREVAAAEDTVELKKMSAWYDSDNPEIKTSYKLPHHTAGDGNPANWRGVMTAMGALLGAQGGADIPEGDRKAVHNHLSKHYEQFGETAPELREYTEAELKNLFPGQFSATFEDVQTLLTEIKDLKVSLKEKSVDEPRPSVVKGRSQDGKQGDLVKRYLQISATALSKALELQKKG